MRKIVILLGVLCLQQAYAQQEGKVGINTETPSEILDVKGTAKVQELPESGAGKIYNGANAKATTFTGTRTLVSDDNGVLGYVERMPIKVLYRATAATRMGKFTQGSFIEAPINTEVDQNTPIYMPINTINAIFGTEDSREYVEFPEYGLYKIELYGYVTLESGASLSEQRTFQVLLNKKSIGGVWETVDNQRVLNLYAYNWTAEVIRPLIYIGEFNKGDRISFQMTSQNTHTNIKGGWSKPFNNKYGIQLIITKY